MDEDLSAARACHSELSAADEDLLDLRALSGRDALRHEPAEGLTNAQRTRGIGLRRSSASSRTSAMSP